MSGKEKKNKNCDQRLKLTVFKSIEEENQAEYIRLAAMSPEARLKEFEVLQERVWGKEWTSKPMVKKFKIEKINW